jgi:hypothetical protein
MVDDPDGNDHIKAVISKGQEEIVTHQHTVAVLLSNITKRPAVVATKLEDALVYV